MVDFLVLTHHLSGYYCSQKLVGKNIVIRYVNELHFQDLSNILQGIFPCTIDCFLQKHVLKVHISMIVDFCYCYMSHVYSLSFKRKVPKEDEPDQCCVMATFFKGKHMGIY